MDALYKLGIILLRARLHAHYKFMPVFSEYKIKCSLNYDMCR